MAKKRISAIPKTKIAIDTPRWIVDLLELIDFTKITSKQYQEFGEIIDKHLGKYAMKRTQPVETATYSYPIKQSFVDKINGYNLNSVSGHFQLMAKTMAKGWIMANLPLKKRS